MSAEQYRERFGREPEPPDEPTDPWPDPGAWLGWTQPWPPPSVVVVMADHGDVYLWNRSPGRDPWCNSYTLAPKVLGISPGLTGRLRAWKGRYGLHEMPAAWIDEGWTPAHDLQEQFDARGLDVAVRHHDADASEPAVRGYRRPR
ncbi:hypothetical protein [Klenkia brasiliensis]|uniref:Uncharacterized protein n=1 Tax=Klenkia brasiliensis TaxID=333142 RepID=A0A1G7PWA6_9ACTN|nr:hypothetical protein [Klenkia brasiliensis]SDF89879.1 hypothetical protein SAMN05660324_1222 [Klenkia brasiliensis]